VTEQIQGMLVFSSIMTWLIMLEDFSIFICHESFKTSTNFSVSVCNNLLISSFNVY